MSNFSVFFSKGGGNIEPQKLFNISSCPRFKNHYDNLKNKAKCFFLRGGLLCHNPMGKWKKIHFYFVSCENNVCLHSKNHGDYLKNKAKITNFVFWASFSHLAS